jgi:hypothetical protein
LGGNLQGIIGEMDLSLIVFPFIKTGDSGCALNGKKQHSTQYND